MSKLTVGTLIILGTVYFVFNLEFGIHHDVSREFNKNHYNKYSRFGMAFIISFGFLGILWSKFCSYTENFNKSKINNFLLKKEYRK